MSDSGLFAPPADPALPPDLAGRDLRLLAAGVDAVFQLLIVLGAGIVSVVAVRVSGFGHHGGVFAVVAALGLAWVFSLAVQARLLIRDAQTLGKRWVGIRIVRTNGAAAGPVKLVVMRWLLPLLLAQVFCAPFWILLDAAFVLGRQRRALHDYIAGTRVVRITGVVDAGVVRSPASGGSRGTAPVARV